MQTTTVLPPGGQSVRAVPVQNIVFVPQYVASQPGSPIMWENYASKTSSILGYTQIVIGFLCILFNGLSIGANSQGAFIGHGIWGGAFFILTGAFGVVAGKKRTTCPIITFMVLSILAAALFATLLLSLASLCIATNQYSYLHQGRGRSIAIAMDSVLVALSLLEAVVAIWSSAICCASVCCGRRAQSGIMMQQVTVGAGVAQPLFPAGSEYPQTGNMFQQQAMATAVGLQQFNVAPTSQIPQSTINYPPQYIVTAAPPAYAETAPQGAAGAAETFALMSQRVDEEKKIAI